MQMVQVRVSATVQLERVAVQVALATRLVVVAVPQMERPGVKATVAVQMALVQAAAERVWHGSS